MFNFEYNTPTRVIFGRDTTERVGVLVKEQNCKKVLIHYGSGSVVRSGLLDRVKAALDSEKISYIELGGAVPNPRLSLVYKGIELAKKENADFVLAVGGGSAIDSAKAICYGLANEGDVWDFYTKKRVPQASAPLGVILTLSATGSEMSNSSVITNEDGWLKRGCNNEHCRPIFAIMDPVLTMTLPDYQTACGCTDILMHTMERYFTNGGNMDITDAIAEGLMRTVIKYALVLKNEPDNYEARAEVMWAGSLSHNGLTGCGNDGGDFASHMLEHEIGGMFDVAHGAGLAAVWGSWARYVYKNCLARFVRFAENVMQVKGSSDEETALKGIEAMEDFYRSINMPTNMKELGVFPTDEQLVEMAQKAALGCGGSKGSAMVLHEEDILKIYQMAR
ncbi:MAG: iron-containing alcohol dehydrogenase [Oscillospiraceae bacterium]|nr:iron-containing alcohol dehydrogenase [Oscillospiraceae bacterium]